MSPDAWTRPADALRRVARRLWLAASLLVLAGLPAPAFAAGFDLPALMALLARQPHGEARFAEQRFVKG